MALHPISFDSTWSKWCALNAQKNPAPSEQGVYCVRATDGKNNPIEIMRAIGEDNQGIVYIGSSKRLVDRIGKLLWITSDEAEKHKHHDLIWTWLDYDLERLASRKDLQVRWKLVENFQEMENHLLRDYKRHFKDIPVGNMRIDR